jgi:hypothetical protein
MIISTAESSILASAAGGKSTYLVPLRFAPHILIASTSNPANVRAAEVYNHELSNQYRPDQVPAVQGSVKSQRRVFEYPFTVYSGCIHRY